MDFLHFVDHLLRSVDLGVVVVVVLVEAVVFLVALIWAWLRKKKRIEAQILLADDQRLAQRIQSQQTEIEMLKQQLAQSNSAGYARRRRVDVSTHAPDVPPVRKYLKRTN